MTASTEQSINPKALAWTIGVHILLLLLFFFWRYTLPVVIAAPEMGMEVNLGTSDNGSGADQPMSTEDPAADKSAVAYKSASQSSSQAKDIVQSNDADAPAIIPATEKKNKENNAVTETNKRKASDNQHPSTDKNNHQQAKYVYAGSSGKGGNSAAQDRSGTNEGNTTGNGDRGVPGGTSGATNYTGSPGNGNGGISHTLSGRTISPDRFEASFRSGGKVTIRVTVDRNGTITEKHVVSAPSAELSRLALQKLSQAKFSPGTEPEQFGTVTIVFKTHS